MDEYQVQAIADRAARDAADDVRRDHDHKIDELERRCDRLARDLDDAQRALRLEISAVREGI